MRLKLTLGFLTIFIMLWAVCFYTLLSGMKVRQLFFELGRDVIPRAIAMSDMENKAFEIAHEVKEYLAHGEDKNIKNVKKGVKNINKIGEDHLKYAKKKSSEEVAAKELLEKIKRLNLGIDKISALKAEAMSVEELFNLEEKIHPEFESLLELIKKLKAARMNEMELADAGVSEKHNYMIKNVKIIGIAATLVSLIVVLLLDRLFIKYSKEHDEAVKVIHESEKKLSTILNSIGDAVIAADTKGQIVGMNPEAERLTGWEVKEAMGHSLSEVFNIVNVTTGESIGRSVKNVINEEIVVELSKQTLLINHDGEKYHITGRGTPLLDDNGLQQGVAIIFRDETVEYYEQQALQENESRFRLITFNTYELIYDWDFKTNEFKWFGSIDEVLGYRPPTFVEWESVIHPKDKNSVIAEYQKIVSEKSGTFDMKYRIKRQDGAWRTLIDRGGIILNKKGEPYKWVGACTDITEHKWTEKTLREKEYYFRSLLNNIDEDILVINDNYKITYVNDTFLSRSGQKREQVVGRNCFKFLYDYDEPCDKRGKECKILDVFETGKSCSCVHEHQRADGSIGWEDILISPLKNAKGKVTRVIETIRDVTDIMRAKDTL